jgi:NADH dehydrogenase [ubiquinone] 1 alpha subcomplex assembly factor 5
MNGADIFDRTVRRKRRDRIAASSPDDRWLLSRMAQELCDRWQDTGLTAKRFLIVGHDCDILLNRLRAKGVHWVQCDASFALSKSVCGIQCDEDRLPFANGAFDAIFWVGSLDSVNDVPGALILMRRALSRGGAFLGAFLGAGSLPVLRDCVTETDSGPMVARLHPQIDVRAAGDLLSRAGFARPVADAETITARYTDLSRLISDLRVNGLGNVLNDRVPVTRKQWDQWRVRFDAKRDRHGKVTEIFAPIHLIGYGPGGVASK